MNILTLGAVAAAAFESIDVKIEELSWGSDIGEMQFSSASVDLSSRIE